MQTNPRAKGQKQKKMLQDTGWVEVDVIIQRKKISQPNAEWQLIEQTKA